jgi:hypothetical protein
LGKYKSYKTKEERTQIVKQLVKQAGGPLRITRSYLRQHARGLIKYYKTKFKKPETEEYVPLLYWILKDAGYKLKPKDCVRGIRRAQLTKSMHGHWNHSIPEALVDDWLNDIVGKAHLHDVIYPGQEDTYYRKRLNCDFVLLHPKSKDPLSGLWIEYAGLLKAKGGGATNKQDFPSPNLL